MEDIQDAERRPEQTTVHEAGLEKEQKPARKKSQGKNRKAAGEQKKFGFIRGMFSNQERERGARSSPPIQRWIMVVLLLVPLLLSILIRIQPAYLPITEEWATNSLENVLKEEIQENIQERYPKNLPPQNLQVLVEKEYQAYIQQNKALYRKKVEDLSQQFKNHLQDATGQTYLLEADPYLYFRHTRNLLTKGHVGDVIKTPCHPLLKQKRCPWDTYTLAPIGEPMHPHLHHYVELVTYKIWGLVDRDVSLMKAVFYVPVILSMLAIIPIFFLTRKFAGNLGGFFAAMLMAVHPRLMEKTVAGFSDTDPYSLVFPLFILWLMVEAFQATERRTRLLFAGLAGLLTSLYSFAWGGWWYIFDFIVIGLMGYMLYLAFVRMVQQWRQQKSGKENQESVKEVAFVLGVFILSTVIFVELLFPLSTEHSYYAIRTPLHTLFTLKEQAKETLWPNVYTTVSELKSFDIPTSITVLGGKFLLLLSFLGVYLFFSKGVEKRMWYIFGSAALLLLVLSFPPENILLFAFLLALPMILALALSIWRGKEVDIKLSMILLLWFLGMLFAASRALRFSILLVPPMAIGLGLFVGVAFTALRKWMSKSLHLHRAISSVFLILLFCLLLIEPVKSGWSIARGQAPIYDDVWDNAMQTIKEQTKPDAIITSWWDFGHWFKAMADRPVTFDGGNQNNPQAHWVGKFFLTWDEKEALGILRMLDCGAHEGFDVLQAEVKNPIQSIDLLYAIVKQNKHQARATLEQAYLRETAIEEVLKRTHCKPPEAIVITSQDMIAKASVWSHFGSWDFRKAKMWLDTKDMNQEERKEYLMTVWNLTEQYTQAMEEEMGIEGRTVNLWIAPTLEYGSLRTCNRVENNTFGCPFRIQGQDLQAFVNAKERDAVVQYQGMEQHPKYFVYAINDSVIIRMYEESELPAALGIINERGTLRMFLMSPGFAGSMFTKLYFFNGLGTEYFNQVIRLRDETGPSLAVWSVDWEKYLRDIGEQEDEEKE